jgi:hypothetical protein
MDNIFTIKQIIENCIRQAKEVHTSFTDLEMAYDSVPIYRLWKEMEKTGLRRVLIKAPKKLYENNYIRIKNGNELSELVLVDAGLTPGCCLSPALFKIYLEQNLEKWKRHYQNIGITIGDCKLYSLYFADDQVVVAKDKDNLGHTVRKLKTYYEQVGLKVNMEKSEYLVVGNDKIEDLQLENGLMKE